MSAYTTLADVSLEKPLTDERAYRFIKLNNNDLHVLLISDPTTDHAAAALDVNVGSFTDRKYDVSGLAHFCEHLLFMGTEKYPQESEYSDYLNQHSGVYNAYTAAEHTNYFFKLSSDYLEGALDRFAQFFIAPLFSTSCKDREILAVDSENKKNLQNDEWRLYQLEKSLSNPLHPYNGFSTGNYETLHNAPISQGLNVRDVLIDFHSQNYSSNRMSLVILGKENLDTLTSWAIEKFEAIPNKDLPKIDYGGELIFTPEQLTKVTKAKPISDRNTLDIAFLIPDDFEKTWNINPSGYFSHLIGHESEGSIYHHLKLKGWVSELSSGYHVVAVGSGAFEVSFELTPQGVENWEKIILVVFEYLKLVVNDEPKKWIWDEVNNISKVNFKFRQKQDAFETVHKLSSTLHKYGTDGHIPSDYVFSSSTHREFDSDAIKQFGTYLNPDNFKVMLVSKLLDDSKLSDTERWYGTQYSHTQVSEELLSEIKSVQLNSELNYPSPNEFIPENFTVLKKKSEKPLNHPYLLEENNKLQFWFKQDDRFEIPKGSIDVGIHLPSTSSDIKSTTYSTLVAELLEDELNQITYYASRVGLKVSLIRWRDGYNISISGYNDKLPILLEHVLAKFVNFKPNKERFETIKYKLTQELKNFFYSVPYQQIGTHLWVLVNDLTYTYEDKIAFLEKEANFNDLYEFSTKSIWEGGVFAEVLVHGNFDIGTANEVKSSVAHHLKEFRAIDSSLEVVRNTVTLQNYVLPKNSHVRYEVELGDAKNINSTLEYLIQISPNSKNDRLRVLSDLLSVIIKAPAFNQLRSKEQLGYVVFSGVKLGRTSIFYRILVQSERSTDYLEYRVEEFLEAYFKHLNTKLTDEEFDSFKESLKILKLAKLKSLREESSKFWNEITSGKFDFEVNTRHVDILADITKKELLDFIREYIFNESKETAKIIVHLKSQVVPEQPTKKLVQSSLVNFIARNELEIGSDVVDVIVEKNLNNHEKLVDEFIEELKKTDSDKISGEFKLLLFKTLEEDLKHPVPEKYPTGKLYNDVQQFRSDFSKGGAPTPFKPLSEYYYPEGQSRL